MSGEPIPTHPCPAPAREAAEQNGPRRTRLPRVRFAACRAGRGFLWAMLVLGAATGQTGAKADTLEEAQQHLLRGRYAEAADIFAPRAKDDPDAALGLARSLAARGRQDEARRALTPLAGEHGGPAAELARLAFQRGDYAEARRRALAALALQPGQPLARWILAELDRVSGRLDEAELGYRQLIRYYNSRDRLSAEELRWVGLGAAQYARWKRIADQFDFLVNELYPQALEVEADFWPAHYEAGLLFLEKYNYRDAADQLQAALRINPQAAEVHAALARLAMKQRETERAEERIARALELNPRLLEAWLARADLLTCDGNSAEALKVLQSKALPLNPLSEATLGRIAACYLLLDSKGSPPAAGPQAEPPSDRFGKLVAGVEQLNPHAGEFYFTLARQLEERNKLPQAEQYLLRAMEVMPQLLGPQAYLGQVYMRAGREDEARVALRRAFRDDPFHVRAYNFLEVLDVLDEMETRTTEHAVLKYAAESDRLLAPCAAEYVDRIWPELCERFGYRPPEKVLVEFFSQARGLGGPNWLAARLAGVPDTFTVGASTGMMVGMVSPCEAARAGGAFNWEQVLRHELVHVITIRQTHYNIPRWFTEGLAVYCEQTPRQAHWNRRLHRFAAADELLDLSTIDEAYTRPGNTHRFQLAYCQGELYVEYMLQLGGWEAVLKMLDAYAAGSETAEALSRVFGMSLERFESGYRTFVDEQLAATPALPWPEGADVDTLLAQVRQQPDDAGLSARLALAYLRRGAWEEARRRAEQSRRLDADEPLAAYVLASLALREKRTDEAVELLEKALDHEHPHPSVLNLLASLRLKAKEYDRAAELYELGRRLDATTTEWTTNLARTCLLAGDEKRLAEALARLAELETDNILTRLKLAQLALDQQDYARAAAWARRAREINPADPRVHGLLGRALAGSRQFDQAREELELAIELEPDNQVHRLALARVWVETGRHEQARELLKELFAADPENEPAHELLDKIEQDDQ